MHELLERLQSIEIYEIILATNPNLEGEATAAYLARMIEPLSVRVTRLAHGLPVGADVEYADERTLNRAMQHRVSLNAAQPPATEAAARDDDPPVDEPRAEDALAADAPQHPGGPH